MLLQTLPSLTMTMNEEAFSCVVVEREEKMVKMLQYSEQPWNTQKKKELLMRLTPYYIEIKTDVVSMDTVP